MASKMRERKGSEPAIVRVAAHPLRVQALSILVERAASPKELAAELGTPIGNISYHVRELEQLGLIELVEEKPRRGAVEHFFRAVTRPLLTGKAWARLSAKQREALSTWVFQLILADAARAFDAGTFDRRDDRHLSHAGLRLDEQGWKELTELQDEALNATLAIGAASEKRLEEAGEAGFPASAAMTCFEMPPQSGRS